MMIFPKQNLGKNDHDEVAMVKEVIYRGRQLSQSRGPLNKLNSTPDISRNCSRNTNFHFFLSKLVFLCSVRSSLCKHELLQIREQAPFEFSLNPHQSATTVALNHYINATKSKKCNAPRS